MSGALASGSLWMFVVSFLAGLAASVTPCTYPVLPLTVGFIGNMAEGKKSKAAALSLTLVLGMAFVYAILGVVLAAIGAPLGSLAGNGWLMFCIALFFVVMSLYLMDVFQFPELPFLGSLQGKVAGKRGFAGALLIGGISALVVGPCTGPILAVIAAALVASLKAATGAAYLLQLLKGGVLLFLFGFGQGALILLCGFFSGFITMLPKAGQWMVAVKKAFGFMVLLAACLVFVHVGQATDFPSLIGLLSGLESQKTGAEKTSQTAPMQISTPASTPAVKSAGSGGSANVGEIAPEFALPSHEGATVTLSELKGKKGVMLVFFATWCAPCMAEVPEVIKIAAQARDNGVEVYGVDFKQELRLVEKFVKDKHVTYPVLLDKDGKVSAAYQVVGVPMVIGIDSQGVVRYRESTLPNNLAEFFASLTKGLNAKKSM